MEVMDRFSKVAHFVGCHSTNDASHIADLYFKEMVHFHGLLRSMVLDWDTNFMCHF